MRDSVIFRMATPDDAALPSFDFTKLSAVNSCPRYGIVRYTHHKVMPSGGGTYRNMALEAGSAMHECFSAIRLWQLGYAQGRKDLMQYHGRRLFGEGRWGMIEDAMSLEGGGGSDDMLDATRRAAALECLSTANYVDDGDDKRRTYFNLEASLLYYAQRWDHTRYPVWIRDPSDPHSDVGIEIPFSLVIETEDGIPLFRYTGRVDGIHTDTNGSLLIQENKTASRLSTAWKMAFNTSHQVTGYCIAAEVFTGQPIDKAIVLGVSIPLPRTVSEGLAMEYVTRPPRLKQQWLEWVLHTVALHNAFMDEPLAAPMYTHSCNRYFSPCSLIPLCAATDMDEQRVILDEMVEQEWSPLAEAH